MLFRFCVWSVEQFPQSCCDQQSAEKLFHDLHIQLRSEKRADPCGNAPGEYGGEYFFDLDCALFPSENAGYCGGWEEEQQVDPTGDTVVHSQYHSQPKDQKASASDPKSGQKSKYRTDGYRCRPAL